VGTGDELGDGLSGTFDSMAVVERKLIEAILFLERSPKIVQSITGFKWIVDVLKRSNR
jgi:hypothetical protein